MKFLSIRLSILSILMLGSSACLAQAENFPLANFLSDGFAFVPPSCVSFADPPQDGDTVISQVMQFPELNNSSVPSISVRVNAWRVRCPDGNTIINMNFENISGIDNVTPGFTGIIISNASQSSSAALSSEPSEFGTNVLGNRDTLRNFWGINDDVSFAFTLTRDRISDFLDIDIGSTSPLSYSGLQQQITIRFLFGNLGALGEFNEIIIPPANQMVASTFLDALPLLTGRHSGNWIVEGSTSQGILLSVSELPNRQILVFLAWFTYDANGNPTWFTGNGFFDPGQNTVNFNLNRSTSGSFNTSAPPTNSVVGTASLSVVDCSELMLSFDLTSQNLEADTVSLVRLFEGEIAGYTCRDLESRQN